MLKQDKIPQGLSSKLTDKWAGPFRIMDTGPNFTYKLKTLKDNKTHKSLISASRLKPYHQRHIVDLPGFQQADIHQHADMPLQQQQQLTDVRQTNNTQPQADVHQPNDGIPQNADNKPAHTDAKSKAEHATPAPVPAERDMSNIRIIHASRKGGKQRYRIEWPDGVKAWETEQNVSKTSDRYLSEIIHKSWPQAQT